MARDGSLQLAVDPGDHLAWAEGLDEVGVGATPTRIDIVRSLAARRHHTDNDVFELGVALDEIEQLQAIHGAWHHDVEQDQARLVNLYQLQGGSGALGFEQLVFLAQGDAHQQTDIRAVINDQNSVSPGTNWPDGLLRHRCSCADLFPDWLAKAQSLCVTHYTLLVQDKYSADEQRYPARGAGDRRSGAAIAGVSGARQPTGDDARLYHGID